MNDHTRSLGSCGSDDALNVAVRCLPPPSAATARDLVGAAGSWAIGGAWCALFMGARTNPSSFSFRDWFLATTGLARVATLAALAIPACWIAVLAIRVMRSRVVLSDGLLSVHRARSTMHLPRARIRSVRACAGATTLELVDGPTSTLELPSQVSERLAARSGVVAALVAPPIHPPPKRGRGWLACWLGRLSGAIFVALIGLSVVADAIDRDSARTRVFTSTVLGTRREEGLACAKVGIPRDEQIAHAEVCEQGASHLEVEDAVEIELDPSDPHNVAFVGAGRFEARDDVVWTFAAIASVVLLSSAVAMLALVVHCGRQSRRSRRCVAHPRGREEASALDSGGSRRIRSETTWSSAS